jgi:hypothetical protein
VGDDSVTCLWDNCGVVYTHLPTLIEHIHNGEFFFAYVEMATLWGYEVRLRSYRSSSYERVQPAPKIFPVVLLCSLAVPSSLVFIF